MELTKEAVLREELYFFNPNKANVYKRKTNTSLQYSGIKFGTKFSINNLVKKTLESNTLWNNTVLGGFIKTNIEIKMLKEVIDWFTNYLQPIILSDTNLKEFVTSLIGKSKIKKEDVVRLLRKADFNISNLILKGNDRVIPPGFIEFFGNKVNENPSIFESLKSKGGLSELNIELEHLIDKEKFGLPFELESEGTQRYYGLAGLLTLLITDSVAFPIDELEASLHPELFTHFLLTFLMNSKSSQLIATTHNREILNNRELFRNDAVWFTHKNEYCSTELYSLADFDTTIVRDTTNVFNTYKIGKLGAVPNLGDYYF